METIRVAEERTAHWRHDMRHMFRLIAAFAREGENEKCLELLQEMDERIVETRAVHYCDNVTLNGVLSGCAAMAQRENVRYKCQADVPKELENTNEFVLAVVLSNLVENAINAASKAEGERWVSVQLLPVKGRFGWRCATPMRARSWSHRRPVCLRPPRERATGSDCKACGRSASGIRRCSTMPRRMAMSSV